MVDFSRRYDVIVIGAGLEGLLCAALLSKHGKRVVVLEEAPVPGGASFHIDRSGYTFLKGPNLFLGFERDGLYDRLFNLLGLSLSILKREGVMFQKSQPPLQIVLPNHRLDYFAEIGDLLEELKREFPDEIQEIKAFWSEMGRWEELIRPRMQQAHRGRPNTIPEWINELRKRMRYYSAIRTLRRHRGDEFLQRHRLGRDVERGLELFLLIFNGKTLLEANGLDLVHLLGLIQREIITISGGIPQVVTLLVKVIQENQGEVIYGHPVAELIVKHRSVDGVRAADGECIHGSAIVLNLPWHLADHGLSGRKEFTLYFGVDQNVLPTPMKSHLLFLRSYERPPLGDNFLYLRLNTAQEEWAAPPNRRALQVTGYLPESDVPRREIVKSLVHSVSSHLSWLMPFSSRVLTFIGDDLGETEASARIPLALAEQVQTAKAVNRDGACFYLTSLKNLYLLPDLGRRPVATLESGRSALELADLVEKNV